MARKTVRVVIIGNEVLSGKVADANTPWLLGRLRQIGAVCTGVRLVPDVPEGIARAVCEDAAAADRVITTGGVGPTHDDITMAAIAAGFGVDVIEHPVLLELLAAHIPGELSEPQRRLARVPDGAELLDGGPFPTVRFRNVYILPGVPALVRRKFEGFAPDLAGERLPCAAVRTSLRETELAPYLEAVLVDAPGADIGSYPRRGQDGWRVLLTIEATTQELLDRGLATLLARVPPDAVHDVVPQFHPEDEGGLGE